MKILMEELRKFKMFLMIKEFIFKNLITELLNLLLKNIQKYYYDVWKLNFRKVILSILII